MTDYFLSKGSHPTPEDGRCAMEFVSYLAGERHSDSPACVSPVLTRFCRQFNDVLDDERRQRLRPYLARTIGTRDDGLDMHRSWLAVDWLIRTYVPTWLSGLDAPASRLRAAGVTAWDAAWEAAWDAAWDAPWPTVIALQDSAFDLLGQMLPTEVIQLPVVADAAEVCGLPIGA